MLLLSVCLSVCLLLRRVHVLLLGASACYNCYELEPEARQGIHAAACHVRTRSTRAGQWLRKRCCILRPPCSPLFSFRQTHLALSLGQKTKSVQATAIVM